jgi:hypothetical protein
MTDRTLEYLELLRKDKLAQAELFRAVAATVKVTHKRVTTRTVDHPDTYISTYYGRSLSVRYTQHRKDLYKAHEHYDFKLESGDGELTPSELKVLILQAATYAEVQAAGIADDIKRIASLTIKIAINLRNYNAQIDTLTSYSRDALGLQHIYNYQLGV